MIMNCCFERKTLVTMKFDQSSL